MKKTVSGILAVILACTLLLGCAGCGRNDNEILTGAWQAAADGEFLFEGKFAGDARIIADHFDFSGITFTAVLNFKEDGTYTLTADPASLDAMMADAEERMRAGILSYLEAAIKEQGLDMTVEEFLTEAETSVDWLLASFDTASFAGDFAEAIASEGQYLAKDGKLYLSSAPQTPSDTESGGYVTYTLSGDLFTLQDRLGAEAGFSSLSEAFPLQFKKTA